MPRDALIADISPAHLRGASFGLHQSLDTVGAFAGPFIAIGLMWLTADNFNTVFWVAVIPAFLTVAVLLFWVKEPQRLAGLRQPKMPLSRSELSRLGATYWWVVAIAAVFTLAFPQSVRSYFRKSWRLRWLLLRGIVMGVNNNRHRFGRATACIHDHSGGKNHWPKCWNPIPFPRAADIATTARLRARTFAFFDSHDGVFPF